MSRWEAGPMVALGGGSEGGGRASGGTMRATYCSLCDRLLMTNKEYKYHAPPHILLPCPSNCFPFCLDAGRTARHTAINARAVPALLPLYFAFIHCHPSLASCRLISCIRIKLTILISTIVLVLRQCIR